MGREEDLRRKGVVEVKTKEDKWFPCLRTKPLTNRNPFPRIALEAPHPLRLRC